MQTWDCLSCGAPAQTKPYCEQCGAAQPVDGGEDSALSLMLGLVCERCDAYNDPGVAVCTSCGAPLAAVEPEEPPPPEASPVVPPSWLTPPTGQPLSTQFAMKAVDLATVATGAEGAGLAAPSPLQPQARTGSAPPSGPNAAVPAPPTSTPPSSTGAPASERTCAHCDAPLAPEDRFCRNCGTRVGAVPPSQPMATMQIAAAKMPNPNLPSPILPQGGTMVMPAMHAAQAAPQAQPSTTLFFGAATAERTAKLVLVRGQSAYGSQWRLQAGETVIGRADGMVLFPDDDALAIRHCKLVFRGADLWLEPEDTTNGVFVKVREPAQLARGDEIVVGAQRLRVLGEEDRPVAVRADPGTRILGSLVKPAPPITLLRIGPDPVQNEVFYRCQRLLTLGRSNCDVNFPRDSFVSERHAQLTHDGNGLVLEDLRSRNGTYVRARSATRLLHGDLVLLGDKVLRVELPR